MPVHDWTKVAAGIYHDFHLGWLFAIKGALNKSLPSDFYALAEQSIVGKDRFGPDVLTLVSSGRERGSSGTVLQKRPSPQTSIIARSDDEFYRKKKNHLTIRHVSDDRVVAVIEVVSPGNKSSRSHVQEFVDKAVKLLTNDIHLLIVDPFPPGKNDSLGLHAAIWEEYTGEKSKKQPKPLTAIAYERSDFTTAYVEPFAVGDVLPEMPVFLEPDVYVDLNLESTYIEAYAATPKRWQEVLESE